MDKKIIHTVFNKVAASFPDRIAVQEEASSITYSALSRNVNRFAHLLRAQGVERGDVVAVLLPPGIALTESLLSIFIAGAVYLPLDEGFSQKRFGEIFERCRPVMVITNSSLYATLNGIMKSLDIPAVPVMMYEEEAFVLTGTAKEERHISKLELPDTFPETVNQADDGCYIVYTSGSTGAGKAILGCHKSLSHFIHWELKTFNIDETIRVGQLAQITFDASFRDILVPLCAGGTLCIPGVQTKAHPSRLIAWMEHAGIQVIHCVPAVFKMLTKELQQEEKTLPRLRELKYIFMAGEVLFVRDIAAWRAAAGTHTELVNLYGTSESTMAKTFHRIGQLPDNPAAAIHAGKPIDNTLVAIINDGVRCLPGEIGDIYIKTPFYTEGYYKDEQLTAGIFVPNPLTNDPADVFHRTGDIGRWSEDGNIEVLGRLDDQVKINGIRVNLGEIKQAVLSDPRVKDVQVLAINEDGNNLLICYYIGSLTEDELLCHLKTMLNAGLLPAYLVKMTAFPLNMHGKVDRKMLPKPTALLFSAQPYEPVINETEKRVEQIWKEVLLQEKIGRNMSFFRIGGTSLRAMQVISRIHREFNVEIRLAEFFNAPTVEALAALIPVAGSRSFSDIPALPRQENYELSPMQLDLWVTDRLHNTAANLYNMVNVSVITGAMNVELFEKSLSAVINRHESLRTTFVNVNNNPRQRVSESTGADHYFRYFPLDEKRDMHAVAAALTRDEQLTGFDLEHGPLLRVKLVQTGINEHICLVNFHHIIADGWSVELFTRDLRDYYHHFISGTTPALPALQIQYKDYSHWLNTQLQGNELARLERYWKDKLDGELPVTELPLDHPRPAALTAGSSIYNFKMGSGQSRALTELAARKGVTLFVLLNTILTVLVFKLTGKRDLLTGAPFSGRLHKSLEHMLGLFVNIVLLRISVRRDDTFSTLLERNNQEILTAWQHQLYPFNNLASLLNYQQPPNRFPFVNVLVQSQNNPVTAAGTWGSDLELNVCETAHITGKTDITFNFIEDNGIIQLAIEYKTDLFLASTIEKLRENICHIADHVTREDTVPLLNIKLIKSADEDAEERLFREQMYNL